MKYILFMKSQEITNVLIKFEEKTIRQNNVAELNQFNILFIILKN